MSDSDFHIPDLDIQSADLDIQIPDLDIQIPDFRQGPREIRNFKVQYWTQLRSLKICLYLAKPDAFLNSSTGCIEEAFTLARQAALCGKGMGTLGHGTLGHETSEMQDVASG